MDWTDLAQKGDQWRDLVNTVMNLRVPSTIGKFLNNCTTGGFSRRVQLHLVRYMYFSPICATCLPTLILILSGVRYRL
jgi:hypothetical protein